MAQSSSSVHGLTLRTRSGFIEGGHQLEKLEFALAIAEARGDNPAARRFAIGLLISAVMLKSQGPEQRPMVVDSRFAL